MGHARTGWPQALKEDFCEEDILQSQVLTFFNAMENYQQGDYGNQCTYRWKNVWPNKTTNLKDQLMYQNPSSLKVVILAPPTKETPYKVFYPGIYDYTFELPIDNGQLETTKAPYGSVNWELLATIDRAGIFNGNLHIKKELSFVRVPDPLSVEMMESIVFSRQWEDQLRYDITISGKSFPIGRKIPIVLKLRPLDKIRVHGLRVTVTELIQYCSNDRKVTRKTPARIVLLLDKRAGKAVFPTWTSSDLRIVRDDELLIEPRGEARETAEQLSVETSGPRAAAEPLLETQDSLLDTSDPRSESFWDATEIEAQVQLPTCRMMARREESKLHPKCTWMNIRVSHTIEVSSTSSSYLISG
jgi:hypothetical protein